MWSIQLSIENMICKNMQQHATTYNNTHIITIQYYSQTYRHQRTQPFVQSSCKRAPQAIITQRSFPNIRFFHQNLRKPRMCMHVQTGLTGSPPLYPCTLVLPPSLRGRKYIVLPKDSPECGPDRPFCSRVLSPIPRCQAHSALLGSMGQ